MNVNGIINKVGIICLGPNNLRNLEIMAHLWLNSGKCIIKT